MIGPSLPGQSMYSLAMSTYFGRLCLVLQFQRSRNDVYNLWSRYDLRVVGATRHTE